MTGGLLALSALQHQACPAVVNLRDVNPYVAAALGDWRSRSQMHAHVPRQAAPGVSLQVRMPMKTRIEQA